MSRPRFTINKLMFKCLFAALIAVGCFWFGGSVFAATYYSSGYLYSTNLLSGLDVSSIDSFVYNLSAKPDGTEATVGFNQDGGSTWYNAAGIEGTETLATGGQQTITLTSGWSGANFYYKITFTSDTTGTPVLDDITVNYTSNTAPSISAGPSDGSSSSTTPTNAGVNVSFTATATDDQSDNYYLAICKENSITANNEAAPTCGGAGSWCVSGSTVSGVGASCNYQTSSDSSESNVWYAFVCDHNAASACSVASQGSEDPGSPFSVNHAPSFSGMTALPNSRAVGEQIIFTSTSSDSDTDGSADTVTLYVCKSNDFTGSACGSAGEWCHSDASASNAACNYTILAGDGLGTKNYFGYIIDSHSFTSTSNPISGTFVISGTGSASTIKLNGKFLINGKLQFK